MNRQKCFALLTKLFFIYEAVILPKSFFRNEVALTKSLQRSRFNEVVLTKSFSRNRFNEAVFTKLFYKVVLTKSCFNEACGHKRTAV